MQRYEINCEACGNTYSPHKPGCARIAAIRARLDERKAAAAREAREAEARARVIHDERTATLDSIQCHFAVYAIVERS